MQTLFDQLDRTGTSWKIYNQDMGNDPAREEVYECGIPGDPSGAGVPDPGGAEATDQYVPKHNPAPWFHLADRRPTGLQGRRPARRLPRDHRPPLRSRRSRRT